MMRKHVVSTAVALALALASCVTETDPVPGGSGPADLLQIIGGRAVQWNGVKSHDAFMNSLGGTSPSATPSDMASYVGASKAIGPGVRIDVYYVAIAGPTDAVGDVLCVAPAEITTQAIAGFPETERLLVTETWGMDTCGWELSGGVTETVYAWDDANQLVHVWAPNDENPPELPDPSGTAFLTLCQDPSVALSDGNLAGHPESVCDIEALFGAGNYEVSTTPWQLPDSSGAN